MSDVFSKVKPNLLAWTTALPNSAVLNLYEAARLPLIFATSLSTFLPSNLIPVSFSKAATWSKISSVTFLTGFSFDIAYLTNLADSDDSNPTSLVS